MAFSPQEPLLVSAGRDGSVRLWDAIGGQERVTLNTDAKLVAFAPDGGCIALADEAGQISLLRASTLEDALAGQRWRAFEDRDCPFTVIRNAMDELRRENLELAKELFLQAEEGIVGDVVGSMWTPELVDAYLLFARVGVSPHGKSPAEMIVHARELAAERLERHPAEDSAYLARARVYAAEGDWPAAVDCMRRTFALPYGSQAVRAWSPVTLRYLRDGEIDRYQQCCRLMAQRIASFDDPKAWYSLGWTCCQGPDALEDWTPLLDFGRRAVAEAPGSREYAVMLGGVLLRSGAHDEAADFLAKLIDRFEAQHQILTFKVHAHFLCAMAEWRAGRQDEARRRLAAARELAQQPWQGAPLSHPKSPLLLESEAVALIK
ncbi:MAG TPA: hypothetical protein PKC18_08550 [Lacipirellulaceae bacterium]|nr:hypothetical protein [Lacipirellulaceae bacterium]